MESTSKKTQSAKGTMFWHEDILKAYQLAKRYAGKKGRVATMPDIIASKIDADSNGPMWNNYFTTTSGEFYGTSRGGIPIVVVAHGIDEILQSKEIIKRSMRDLRENSHIQLTPKQFHRLEDGSYAPVEVLEHSVVVNMREYPTSVLSYADAMMNDPLLIARVGPKFAEFFEKHARITREESENDFIIHNNHRYPYLKGRDIYTGGLLHIGRLCDVHRCGGEPTSVSSEIDVADLASAGRFVAITGEGYFGRVNEDLETIFRDFENNWQRLTIPNPNPDIRDLYLLHQVGDTFFTEYKDENDVMNTGIPQFHVTKLKKVGDEGTFTTEILGYHGFFKYHLADVRKMKPNGANAYQMGEPTIVWEGGNPEKHTAPIQFYHASVDTSIRILRENEVKRNMSLIRILLTGA